MDKAHKTSFAKEKNDYYNIDLLFEKINNKNKKIKSLQNDFVYSENSNLIHKNVQ